MRDAENICFLHTHHRKFALRDKRDDQKRDKQNRCESRRRFILIWSLHYAFERPPLRYLLSAATLVSRSHLWLRFRKHSQAVLHQSARLTFRDPPLDSWAVIYERVLDWSDHFGNRSWFFSNDASARLK